MKLEFGTILLLALSAVALATPYVNLEQQGQKGLEKRMVRSPRVWDHLDEYPERLEEDKRRKEQEEAAAAAKKAKEEEEKKRDKSSSSGDEK